MITQIYEIQTPKAAEDVIALGVDHVGSVVLDEAGWKQPVIRETVARVKTLGAASSLIPLFSRPQTVFRTLEYYRPSIVHFCEAIPPGIEGMRSLASLVDLQKQVRQRFPQVKIMRSIPICRPGAADANSDWPVQLAREFESSSDFFLTDTFLSDPGQNLHDVQPVSGFVGITGLTCDWRLAKRLLDATQVPVILAGGLSPQNVYDAVLQLRPAGVDSCSATNAVDAAGAPIRFKKELARVHAFVQETRRAQKEFTQESEGR